MKVILWGYFEVYREWESALYIVEWVVCMEIVWDGRLVISHALLFLAISCQNNLLQHVFVCPSNATKMDHHIQPSGDKAKADRDAQGDCGLVCNSKQKWQ